jgi:hypothetical protein
VIFPRLRKKLNYFKKYSVNYNIDHYEGTLFDLALAQAGSVPSAINARTYDQYPVNWNLTVDIYLKMKL